MRSVLRCIHLTSTEHLDIFNELRSEDELLLLARGLGLMRVVTNLLHSYDAAGDNLIVLVGADDRENGWIGEGGNPQRSDCWTVVDFKQRWLSMLPSADPQRPEASARSTLTP